MLIIWHLIGYHLTLIVSLLCMCAIPGGCVTCLFDFHYSGVDAMGGGLKGINQYKRKYYTSLNIFKIPHAF